MIDFVESIYGLSELSNTFLKCRFFKSVVFSRPDLPLELCLQLIYCFTHKNDFI
jgi:hypothetical protein